MEEARKGFLWYSQSWYAGKIGPVNFTDELYVGMYYSHEGTAGEFAINWTILAGAPAARLCAFDDAWTVLAGPCADLLPLLVGLLGKGATGKTIPPTPEAVVDALLAAGYADLTQRVRP